MRTETVLEGIVGSTFEGVYVQDRRKKSARGSVRIQTLQNIRYYRNVRYYRCLTDLSSWLVG